ncbi:hypothetical protein Tco_1283119 [Tanacetum coccineum]
MKVVFYHCSNHHPQALSVAEEVVISCRAEIGEVIMKRTKEITMMPKYDFTIDPNFVNSYEKLKSQNQGILVRALDTNNRMRMVNLHAFGKVEIEQLMIKKVLGKAEGVSKIMGEPDAITKRRDHLHETISTLKKLKDVIANVAP